MTRRKRNKKDDPNPVEAKSKWQVVVALAVAKKEGREELTDGQYLHVTDLIKQLVGFGSRRFASELRIEQFGDFWELKDKGGVLGKKNIRIYFAHESDLNEIVILHFAKKESEGKPHPHLKFKLKNRLREYRKGTLNQGVTRYRYE